MSDRVLIAGGGGREHALAWHVAQSSEVDEVIGASIPGNVGIAQLGRTVPVEQTNILGLLSVAKTERIDFAIASMDNSLAAGLVDAFEKEGIPIFGPTKAAARLEWSKAWASEFMRRHGIPTPNFRNFYDYYAARKYLKYLSYQKSAIKADGLTRGKGVDLPISYEQGEASLYANFIAKRFGRAGEITQIQDRVRGKNLQEFSIFSIADGEYYAMLPFFRDYKRLFDGDVEPNPNTGGIGCYGPLDVEQEVLDVVHNDILRPTFDGMAEEGHAYRGALYVGGIMNDDGLFVIEYNARFGNPEMQPMAVSLADNLYPIMRQSAEGKLRQTEIAVKPGKCVSVTLCSDNYALEGKELDTGHEIHGLDRDYDGVQVFHAGTEQVDDKIINSGGRVLDVVGYGEDYPEARTNAYGAIGERAIHFTNMHYRETIAA